MLLYHHFGDPSTTHFICLLLEGLSSNVINHWKAKYLSHMCEFIFAQYYIHNHAEEFKTLCVQCGTGLAGPILTRLVLN